MKVKQPILLAILDGWGIAPNNKGNAVTSANMKNVLKLQQEYPWVQAHASGKWVGLPEGQMGNSEVGHIHLGSGRIKFESLSLINNAIESGEFNHNKSILAAINHAKKNNSSFHIMGLFSDGGVHSHLNHIFETYKLAVNSGLTKIYLHIFGDGRDTKPSVIKDYIKQFEELQKQYNNIGAIASVSGRYYAMDRDKKYDRIKLAYDNMFNKTGVKFNNIYDYIDSEYQNNRTDEFLIPGFNQKSVDGNIQDNDSVFFANFRPDRAIALASAITNKNFPTSNQNYFLPKRLNLFFVSMMEYADTVDSPYVAFKAIEVINGLGEWLSKKGYRQLRIAETEKIAHVTFFFDGGKDYFKNGLALPSEITLSGASIDLIPSPKIATYDLQPSMSAYEITDKLIEEIKKQEFDLIVLNFANCDMVGHTGVLPAAISAVKVVDECLGKIYEALQKVNGIMILTADHGNAEIMLDENNQPNKKHTSQLVPIIITKKDLSLTNEEVGIANVAPTILELMGIEVPKEMTEKSLIIHK